MPRSSSSTLSLSPSGASRWLKCKASPGFLAANADKLPKQEFDYTKDGILAHDYAAHLLTKKDWNGTKISAEMQQCCEGYAKFVRDNLKMYAGATLYVEQKVPLFYDDTRNGIVDASIVGKSAAAFVDLKYGEGVSVEAKDNPQLAIYAMSSLKKYKVVLPKGAKVLMVIYQPRARDGRFVRKWEPTYEELLAFCEKIQDTASDIMLDPDNQPFFAEPDSVCRFCDAQSLCPTYAGTLLGDIPAEVETKLALVPKGTPQLSKMEFPKAETLTVQQLSKLVHVKRDFIAWLESVEEFVIACHKSGNPVPGTKMVQGRGGHRKWKDEDAAFRLLKRYVPRDKLRVTSFVSPAEAEKLLRHPIKQPGTRFLHLLEEQIIKPPGNPTLVVEEDPRPAIDINVAAEFSDLTKEDQTLL